MNREVDLWADASFRAISALSQSEVTPPWDNVLTAVLLASGDVVRGAFDAFPEYFGKFSDASPNIALDLDSIGGQVMLSCFLQQLARNDPTFDIDKTWAIFSPFLLELFTPAPLSAAEALFVHQQIMFGESPRDDGNMMPWAVGELLILCLLGRTLGDAFPWQARSSELFQSGRDLWSAAPPPADLNFTDIEKTGRFHIELLANRVGMFEAYRSLEAQRGANAGPTN